MPGVHDPHPPWGQTWDPELTPDACRRCKLVRTDAGYVVPENAELSYERLASIRAAASQLLSSGAVFLHEQTHLRDIVDRMDAAVRLKRECDAYKAEREAR